MMERTLFLCGLLFFSEWFLPSPCLLHQYHFVSLHLNWTEAQTYCRQKHTDLVTIRTSEDVDQLTNVLSSAGHKSWVWIGLSGEINWRWSDGFNGSGAEYSNWETYYRSDSEDNFCVFIDINGRWRIDYCTHNHSFFCYNGTQLYREFVFVNNKTDWFSAQRFCRKNFVDLVTVRKETENQMLQNLVPEAEFPWIGGFGDVNFYWSDGSNSLFNNRDTIFFRVNPMRVICGFTSVWSHGKWQFGDCEANLPFVCYHRHHGTKQNQRVKLTLRTEDSVDLNDPVLKAYTLKKLQDRLKEDGVTGASLKWREQPDGRVLKKEKKNKKTEL